MADSALIGRRTRTGCALVIIVASASMTTRAIVATESAWSVAIRPLNAHHSVNGGQGSTRDQRDAAPPRTYEEFASLPQDRDARRIIFQKLPPETSSAIVREHMRQVLVAHPEFTRDQRELILTVIETSTPEMFSAPEGSPLKDLALSHEMMLLQSFEPEQLGDIDYLSAGRLPNHVPADRLRLVVGQPMPDFSFIDFQGKRGRLSGFRGQYVLVQFWGTWCGACRQEVEWIKKAYAAFRGRSLEVLGVDDEQARDGALEPTYERARRFVSDARIEWPQVRGDSVQQLLRSVLIVGFPTHVLLDSKGVILSAGRDGLGELPLRGESLLATLDKVLPRRQ